MNSQERQEIIAALKGAAQPMSVAQIMTAIGRTGRNAVDQLLYKMRKAGEIEVAGRGLYTLGKIGAPVSAPDKSDQGPNLTGLDVAAPVAASNLTEESPTVRAQPEDQAAQVQEPQPPWALSDVELARRAERFQAARKAKGELIANRALRWELQNAGVPYQLLQREVDRITAIANTGDQQHALKRAILRGDL